MIGIYDDEGRFTNIMKIYPPGYLEGLADHDMKGVLIPQELRDLMRGGSFMKEYYMKAGLITPRLENPLPESLTLSVGEAVQYPDMPSCRVILDGEYHDVPAGEFGLEGEVERDYTLIVKCFPMKDRIMKVSVR